MDRKGSTRLHAGRKTRLTLEDFSTPIIFNFYDPIPENNPVDRVLSFWKHDVSITEEIQKAQRGDVQIGSFPRLTIHTFLPDRTFVSPYCPFILL
ncbi:hypothetical protein Gasu2_69460 [Galdieria sulphuraria]|uniref:Uncharacterized protein n=1 Tax=Galdieria sulphuraria TaxID=130081 RepID=M2VSB0_GALSU|nr:uncharacterized protein Gasu_63340 [Galdieria sulphuraria]EME26011.1 hypothetical protein Gasu_63340 [Galdieria sulphuraria]GJD12880.1 hypothetical protein Gasu2_69460 [Galdieria sulphuraria]|eukprot:XP_005702531.1 hypothetical protein Gasu_63340 [Galdieria sulphuraria]